MNKYRIYVDGVSYASCYGWYNARLVMNKLARRYPQATVKKEKVLE